MKPADIQLLSQGIYGALAPLVSSSPRYPPPPGPQVFNMAADDRLGVRKQLKQTVYRRNTRNVTQTFYNTYAAPEPALIPEVQSRDTSMGDAENI